MNTNMLTTFTVFAIHLLSGSAVGHKNIYMSAPGWEGLSTQERRIIKEESFLEDVYRKLGQPKLSPPPGFQAQNIKSLLNSFYGKPILLTPDLEASGSLWIDLERINLEESWSKVILWLPEDWLNSDQRIYTKRILLQPSFNKGNWQGYDITSLVTAKLRRGRRAFSISGMNPTLSKFNNAFLELQQDNARTKRSTRGAGECQVGQDSCCLSSIPVNLTTIGWDFVLSPQIIEFSYCGGHCDPFRLPPGIFLPQMAALRWKIHQTGEHNLPAPCCSPRSYASIEMLYFTDELPDGSVSVQAGKLDDVVATSCKCG